MSGRQDMTSVEFQVDPTRVGRMEPPLLLNPTPTPPPVLYECYFISLGN